MMNLHDITKKKIAEEFALLATITNNTQVEENNGDENELLEGKYY